MPLRKNIIIPAIVIPLLFSAVLALFSSTPAMAQETKEKPDYRGWDYLVDKLKKDGIDQKQIDVVYQDSRMPEFSDIPFSLDPRESPRLYKEFSRKNNIKIALEYLSTHQQDFEQTEKIFGVSRFIVAAILLIETHFGKVTGRYAVVNRLSRLGSIAKPENLQFNYNRLKKRDRDVTFQQVKDRAKYLEAIFYPELKALFEIAKIQDIAVLDILGSSAGAFGISQFLPSSYLNFAVDGNNDGVISLFDHSDAIASTANFIASFGWREEDLIFEKKKILWKYNHSEPYINAIVKVSSILEKRFLPPPQNNK